MVGASGLTLALALGFPHDAAALNECGAAAGIPPSVNCKASGNPYPNGITYDVTDLTIVVKNGVVVDTTGTTGEISGINLGGPLGALPTGTGNLTITANSGVNITVDETMAPGIAVLSGTGSATLNSKANVTTSGGFFGVGLWAQSEVDDVSITAAGKIATSGERGFGINAVTFGDNIVSTVNSSATITTLGDYAFGIAADTAAAVNADTFITSSGKITTSGIYSAGLYSYTHGTDSDISITNTGAIGTAGRYAHGIRAITVGNDSLITISSSGKITTTGDGSDGIFAIGRYNNSDINITSTAKISTSGEGGIGIFANTYNTDSDITINSTAAIVTDAIFSDGIVALTHGSGSDISITSSNSITTSADRADGIEARTYDNYAPVTVVSSGKITTDGIDSQGIYVKANFSDVAVTSTGKIITSQDFSDAIVADTSSGAATVSAGNVITTSGGTSHGIRAISNIGDTTITSDATIKTSGGESDGIHATGVGADVSVQSTGPITTTGINSDGIHAQGVDITIGAGNITASGEDSDGIDAANFNDGAIAITVAGKVSGGWRQGQGVRVKATDPASLSVGAGASVGALSDFAVSEGGDDMSIFNKGTITGFIDLSSGTDNLYNGASGLWQLRDFADTDGDGARDTEGVAFGKFGAGIDSFDNQGTLTLSKAAGATAFNTTGAIVDPHGADGDLTLAGVEQGQLVGLEQFINSGVITLQDNKTGDFLAITDASVAGAGGGGAFTSNGGSLRLDVRLDDGSSGKADMLFLDVAKTGANGATQVFINQAGGAGALTKGDGIEIIHVDVSSDNDAFTLGAPVVAGAFQYNLEFQDLAATDQNWYLRSSPFAGALAYPAISSSALTAWQADLDSIEGRLDDLRLEMTQAAATQLPTTVLGIADGGVARIDPASRAGGWFRVSDSNDQVAQTGTADFRQETASVQFGYDLAVDNIFGDDDWLVLGAFGGQGWSQADFNDADSSAEFESDAMGVYGSYMRGPYHVDALMKFDWLDGEYSSDYVTGSGDVELPVFGVSLRTGYTFDLTKNETGGLSLQPLAALDYAHVGGDSFRDDSGETIELMDLDSLRARVGARLEQQLLPSEDGDGPVGSFHFDVGVAQELLGGSEARVSGVTLRQEMPQTTVELGAGFDIALPEDGVSFTFDTSADLSEGEDIFGAAGGLKFTW